MCYSIYLSTDSSWDLSSENNELLHFKQDAIKEPARSILKHDHQWYVGSKSGCSCTFRHLYSIELGFDEPVDWYPEDEDELAATLSFIKIVRQLVDQGHRVDSVDVWNEPPGEVLKRLDVNLNTVSNEQFRFFENCCFNFTN